MTTTIVAISRQFGSGGAWVGRAVAQRLQFQYADREILAEAARLLRVGPEDLEPLEERIAGFWGQIGKLFALGTPDAPFIPPALPSVSESELFRIERQVITSIAEHGNAVIVGRGAAHVLDRRYGVLRVFLHAPMKARVALAMRQYHIADAESAAAIVRDSDRARARFAKSVTGHDWCDATLYDISLDTAVVGLDRAVDLIVDLVQRPSAASLPPMMPPPADSRGWQ